MKDFIRAAGLRHFEPNGHYSVKRSAQLMMGDRSYFYDTDTLSYFHCRIAYVRTELDGSVMVGIMSQASDLRNTSRCWRFAIHDFTGHHLAGDNSYKSREAAERAADEALAGLDARTVVRETIERETVAHARALVQLKAAARMMR